MHLVQKAHPTCCSLVRQLIKPTPSAISYDLRMCTEYAPFAIYGRRCRNIFLGGMRVLIKIPPPARTHTHAHARSGGRYSIAPVNAEVPPGPRHAATAPSQRMRRRRRTTEGANCLATSSQVPLMNPVALGILLQVQCVGWSAQSARGAAGLPLDPPMPPATPPAPGPGLERIRPTPHISIAKVRSAPIPSLCCTAFLQ